MWFSQLTKTDTAVRRLHSKAVHKDIIAEGAKGNFSYYALLNFVLECHDIRYVFSSHRVGCHIDEFCVNNLCYFDDMVLLSTAADDGKFRIKPQEVLILSQGRENFQTRDRITGNWGK